MKYQKGQFLTKTLLMKGMQCPKQLYLYLNHPELAEKDKNEKSKKEGIELGVLAHRLFPTGILISEKDPIKALTQTNIHLTPGATLFEPAFLFNDLYFRADVLELTPDGVILTEVKSSTDVKPYQIQDASIQALILSKLGYKILKVYLCHINKDYTTSEPIENIFSKKDITSSVINLLPETETKVNSIKTLIKSLPAVEIGPDCTKPFACPFKKHCHQELGVGTDSILNFPYLVNKWDLFKSGKTKISDLGPNDLKTDNQKNLFNKITDSNNLSVDAETIKKIFRTWTKPLYFLDFETFDSIVPKYPQTKPNTPIPYQYSIAVLENGKPVIKESFLADDISTDPRHALAFGLVKSLGKKGSIVTYNMSFERGRIQEMADLIPELRPELLAIKDRVVDLLQVMRTCVYHPDFNMSWSIKSVIPALFGKTAAYSELTIQNGLESQETYLAAMKSQTLNNHKSSLIQYCNKDVLEMANLYLYLLKKSQSSKQDLTAREPQICA